MKTNIDFSLSSLEVSQLSPTELRKVCGGTTKSEYVGHEIGATIGYAAGYFYSTGIDLVGKSVAIIRFLF